MTLSDFIKRLQGMIEGKGVYPNSAANAQVKLGKSIDNLCDVFDYFEVKKSGNDIVLVPTDVWNQNRSK